MSSRTIYDHVSPLTEMVDSSHQLSGESCSFYKWNPFVPCKVKLRSQLLCVSTSLPILPATVVTAITTTGFPYVP